MRLRWFNLLIVLILLNVLLTTAEAARTRNRRANNVSASRGRVTKAANKASAKKSTASKGSATIQAKIVGGTTTSISNVPWLVQVRRSSSFCGGSLINSQWVLTAAHCVQGYSASAFHIIAGTSTFDGSDGIRRTVTVAKVAPKFTSRTMNMDAALLKLSSPINSTKVSTINLASSGPKAGVKVLVAGWGTTSESGSTSTHVRSATLTTRRQGFCRRRYRGTVGVTKNMFCASARNKDTCSGDSGGSAVANGSLVGITSFGVGCARSGYPGIYTRVSNIRSWIAKVIANN